MKEHRTGETGLLQRLRSLPVFWKYLLLMCLLLVMELIVMSISNSIAEEDLRERYMIELQSSLEWQSEQLSETWRKLYDLPAVLENTETYELLENLDSASPYAHVALLPSIQDHLIDQLFLQRDSEECFFYMPQTNGICGRESRYVTVEQFLDQAKFSLTDREILLQELQKERNLTVLPMQEVTLDGEPARCLSLLIRPRECETAVLCLYSEQTILNYFGFDMLPKHSALQLTVGDTCVMEYCIGEWNQKLNYDTLQSKIDYMNMKVQLQIPETYFSEMLRESQMLGRLLLAVTALLGLGVCVLLSDIFTKPVRKLLLDHAGNQTKFRENEFSQLDRLIKASITETETLHQRLMTALLSRAMSGSVLSASEEQQLVQCVELNGKPYQIAILHSDRELNQIIKTLLMGGSSFQGFYCEPINETETGILLVSSEHNTQLLASSVSSLQEWADETGRNILCGVSAPSRSLSELHIAVRQARLAMPLSNSIGWYTGSHAELRAMSWLQHERLYQCIVANDADGAVSLLQTIAAEVRRESKAREIFYNIKFVIHSAAEEMNIVLPELTRTEYVQSCLPKENILQLEDHLRLLFRRMDESQTGVKCSWQEILDWMEENMSDPMLCSETVGTQFGLSERRVREIVRQAVGTSFSKHLTAIRMKQAATLLCTTNYGITEIAALCGYQASSTFYRVFKGYYNTTPNQYRSSGGADGASQEG